MVVWAKWIPEAGMARRWVRFEMPVMVCVGVDEQFEDARVLTVVAGAEAEDVSLARDAGHAVLVYDESMERVSPSDPIAAEAISVAEDRDWPEVGDWEFGPDAFRDPWLYVDDAGTEKDLAGEGYEPVDEEGWRPGRDVRGR
jgi:hypothetical protein